MVLDSTLTYMLYFSNGMGDGMNYKTLKNGPFFWVKKLTFLSHAKKILIGFFNRIR